MITSTEANTALSMSIDNTTILNETSVDILNNLTTSFPPNSTVILSSTTDVNMSDYKSGSFFILLDLILFMCLHT